MHAQSDNRLIFSSEKRWQFPGFVKRAITRWHNKKKLTLLTSQYQEISYPITDYFIDRKSIVSNNFFLLYHFKVSLILHTNSTVCK